MKGFQSACLGINAQERARTIGKKIANSTVGKSTWPAAIVAALTFALLLPAAAPAQCGSVEKSHPRRKVARRPPIAIGDSSMLLALPSLARAGYNANAR